MRTYKQSTRLRLAAGLGAGLLMVSGPAAMAQGAPPAQQEQQQQHPRVLQANGAAGLVAAIVNLNDVVDAGEILTIDGSFNNLTALNNVLNNNDIDVNVLSIEDALNDLTVVDGDVNVNVTDILQDFLDNNDVDVTVEDIVAVVVLPLGGILVLV